MISFKEFLLEGIFGTEKSKNYNKALSKMSHEFIRAVDQNFPKFVEGKTSSAPHSSGTYKDHPLTDTLRGFWDVHLGNDAKYVVIYAIKNNTLCFLDVIPHRDLDNKANNKIFAAKWKKILEPMANS